MSEKYITRLSNGQSVDMDKLSIDELKLLHYEEERFAATEVLRLLPFSEERKDMLKRGYDFAVKVMAEYLPSSTTSQGANRRNVKLVCKFIDRLKNVESITLFEAGVGRGYGCKFFLRYPYVNIKGCDVYIDGNIHNLKSKYGERIDIEENTFYDCLKHMEDGSIDIFYADNVFEHLCPDEFPETMNLLYTKLKKEAYLILIIPNKNVGPGDVSKFFLKMGEKPEGFHFMEQSCHDVINGYRQYGFTNAYSVFRGGKNMWITIKDEKLRLADIKLTIENIIAVLPKTVASRKLVRLLGLNCYVLKKF